MYFHYQIWRKPAGLAGRIGQVPDTCSAVVTYWIDREVNINYVSGIAKY